MSLTVCKFYELNQTCRFGKHCKFSHSQRPPPPVSNIVSKEENEAPGVSPLTAPLESINLGKSEPCFSRQHDPDLRRNQVEISHQTSPKIIECNVSTRKVCPYFARGWCRYGTSCRFSHAKSQSRSQNAAMAPSICGGKYIPPRFQHIRSNSDGRNTGLSDNLATPGAQNVETTRKPIEGSAVNATTSSSEDGKHQRKIHKICVYFKNGQCRKGVHCKFLHVQKNQTKVAKTEANSPANVSSAPEVVNKKYPTTNPAPKRGPFGLRQVYTLTDLEEADIDKIRDGEIAAIKRRFPKDKIMYENDGKNFVAMIKFVPTDPDWPFDVKEFTLTVVVPPMYPKETLNVTLPLDQDLPTTVRRYVEVSIQEWIQQQQEKLAKSGKVELVFRPFLRWLDRTIEEITTEALLQLKRELIAKASGLEFIPAKSLQASLQSTTESSKGDGKEKEGSGSDAESDESDETENESEDSSSEEEEEAESCPVNHSLELQPQQRGTEISLKYLQLKENAAALLFQRLKVVLQCGRCKAHTDLYVTQGSITSLSCDRCNTEMYATYRPGLLHQFSSVMGYLDVDRCQAFDLVLQDCRASVSCMACNKQTTIDGLVTGQVIDGWCKACNSRFKIAIEAVKLTQLAPSGIDTSSAPLVKVVSSKPKKPPKDPSIREGYPLPEFGACKHYKQSYRWLRFPCCGKAYPCDVCHDKQEDHEMKFANRMICGHCCKEQNYSGSRPCSGCGEHMTKVRSAHWEGGTGCRDKISMSKGDIQKYKNMNKTVSNKKKLETGSKKKNTKLRHV